MVLRGCSASLSLPWWPVPLCTDSRPAGRWPGPERAGGLPGPPHADSLYTRGETVRFRVHLVRALDFLTAQPEWNGRTVIVSGSSQGGAQALVAAGLDSRVTFFVAGVPAMCDHTGFKAGRINGWPKFVPTGEQSPDHVTEAVRYYDAVNFAARTKASGIVTVGFIDTTCPPTGGYAAFNAVAGEATIVDEPLSGHAVPPRSSEAMRSAILRHASAGNAK